MASITEVARLAGVSAATAGVDDRGRFSTIANAWAIVCARSERRMKAGAQLLERPRLRSSF